MFDNHLEAQKLMRYILGQKCECSSFLLSNKNRSIYPDTPAKHKRADTTLSQLQNPVKRYVLIIEGHPNSPGMWAELIFSSEFNYGYVATHGLVDSLWP